MAYTNSFRDPDQMRCANCAIRRQAEANPGKFYARAWKWHTGWCPGWSAYQRSLKAREASRNPAAAEPAAPAQ